MLCYSNQNQLMHIPCLFQCSQECFEMGISVITIFADVILQNENRKHNPVYSNHFKRENNTVTFQTFIETEVSV